MPLTLAQTDKARTQWFRTFMPYCLKKVEYPGRKHVYLPVNRHYKPLGLTQVVGWVDYQEHLHAAMIFSSDPHAFRDVWHDAKSPLFLYNDGPKSRIDYFDRLGRLLARSIATPGRDESEF